MFIFLRLLLAHFIGDFPLQFNKIYELKHKGLPGVVPHALLVTGCSLVLSWPYLNDPVLWCFIIFAGIFHLLQDSIKVSFGKIKYSFWLYLLDQFFHILVISAVFLTDLKNVRPPANAGMWIVSVYNNNILAVYIIALIVATYNGLYLMRSFRMTFLGRAGMYTVFEKWYGMLERGVIVSLFFFGRCFLLLIPFVLFTRPLMFSAFKKKVAVRKRFISAQEMALSWIIAALTGIVLFLVIRRLR